MINFLRWPKKLRVIFVLGCLFVTSGCWLTDIPAYDKQAQAAWKVLNATYQVRRDMVPGFISALEQVAFEDPGALIRLAQAHGRVQDLIPSPDILSNETAFSRFQQAQDGLSTALMDLFIALESSAELTGANGFLARKQQLAEIEDRIAIHRRDYIEAARRYNVTLRTVPGRWLARMFHRKAKLKQIFLPAS